MHAFRQKGRNLKAQLEVTPFTTDIKSYHTKMPHQLVTLFKRSLKALTIQLPS